jgi:septal ring factor EnvC (AmiA/AmiB activator)
MYTCKTEDTQLHDIRNELSDTEKLQNTRKRHRNFQQERKRREERDKNISLKVKQTAKDIENERQKNNKEEEQNLATQRELLFVVVIVRRRIVLNELLSSC